jgi:hypothetical protein
MSTRTGRWALLERIEVRAASTVAHTMDVDVTRKSSAGQRKSSPLARWRNTK